MELVRHWNFSLSVSYRFLPSGHFHFFFCLGNFTEILFITRSGYLSEFNKVVCIQILCSFKWIFCSVSHWWGFHCSILKLLLLMIAADRRIFIYGKIFALRSQWLWRRSVGVGGAAREEKEIRTQMIFCVDLLSRFFWMVFLFFAFCCCDRPTLRDPSRIVHRRLNQFFGAFSPLFKFVLIITPSAGASTIVLLTQLLTISTNMRHGSTNWR